jgi:hypothetical protein
MSLQEWYVPVVVDYNVLELTVSCKRKWRVNPKRGHSSGLTKR